MKITKFVHSCLLVEMPEPTNRTALFDPGVMSSPAIDIESLEFLDDIIITHEHSDHFDLDTVKKLVAKFPSVRVTSTPSVVSQLDKAGIKASSQPSEGIVFFDSPHEDVLPMFPHPEQIGVHYLDRLSDPGDSHSFKETKEILALPVTAPWGSNIKAINLALELKPRLILPIHDWHWSDQAREASYDRMAEIFTESDIKFHKLKTGEPVVIDPSQV
jgi:L-ascorbate metabolism protein UlaG (beta-lactamase superfamily)